MKYPRFLKKNELNGTTDQNFYKILSSKTYIHVSLPYSGNFSVERYTSDIRKYKTDKDFEDKKTFISSSEEEYNNALQTAVSNFGGIPIQNKEIEKLKKEVKELNAKFQEASLILRRTRKFLMQTRE